MFGLDENLARVSNGTTLLVVVAVSIALGLRHASDPDHLAAVTTLIASGKERAARQAARLGFVWGLGHATSLFVFGLPVILYSAYLPRVVQSAAETAVGVMIVVLALTLLMRRRHSHPRTRGARTAFGIGLVHGMGGTAGVGLLLLATIRSHALAVVSLALFAGCTALSMALLSTGFGLTLRATRIRHVAPALGVVSFAFGIWYALGAQGLVPYIL